MNKVKDNSLEISLYKVEMLIIIRKAHLKYYVSIIAKNFVEPSKIFYEYIRI